MRHKDAMTCPLCGGTGSAHKHDRQASAADTERKAVALVTLALDHGINGDSDAFTMEELRDGAGDTPLVMTVPLLAAVTSITACIVRNTADDDDDARDWWSRIAQHILDQDKAS